MSQYLGDFFAGCTITHAFTTRRFSSGAPFTLAGTPNLLVRRDVGAQDHSCVGVQLAVDCMGRTGLNTWEIRTNSDQSFYSCGHDFTVEINVGTVDSVSVVGEVIATFSLTRRSNLRPTIHGRNAVDVTATGAVGIDWGNVENKTTANDLTCTTTFSVHSLDNTVIGVAGNVTGSVASVTGAVGSVTGAVGSVAAGGIAAASFAAGAIDAAAIAANAIGSSEIAADAIGASELNADVINDIWQGTALTEAYAADTAEATPAQLLYMIWSAVANFAVSGTVITTRKVDGCTTAMTFNTNDPTSPTDRTRAT